MIAEESSGAQSVDRRCDVCFAADGREFTDALRAHCPTLAPWLEFVCKRCVKRFGPKHEMSEARAAARAAREKAAGR